MPRTVLVTGGAGYVGSHIVVELARAGYAPVVLDNFANSSPSVPPRLRRMTGQEVPLFTGDVRDRTLLERAFSAYRLDAVIHCAGLKAVGESGTLPLAYYDNNVGGSIALAEMMVAAGVRTLVFSSSATVYGQPERNPVAEDAPLNPASVYGRTKLIVELVLRDIAATDRSWRVGLLRYFNPAGADPSGEIGEAPSSAPNNLVPILAEVAAGRRPCVDVFGDDYATPDGTGVRDYIHVSDLATGHVAALAYLAEHPGVLTVNLGVGHGCSVLDVIAAFERACGKPLPRRMTPRRSGDIAASYANPARANALLGWRATRDIDAICTDAWRWCVAQDTSA
jgi:UDP-glucose 4-epimerase